MKIYRVPNWLTTRTLRQSLHIVRLRMRSSLPLRAKMAWEWAKYETHKEYRSTKNFIKKSKNSTPRVDATIKFYGVCSAERNFRSLATWEIIWRLILESMNLNVSCAREVLFSVATETSIKQVTIPYRQNSIKLSKIGQNSYVGQSNQLDICSKIVCFLS